MLPAARLTGMSRPIATQNRLAGSLASVPESLATYDLELNDEGRTLVYTFDRQGERTRITALLADLQQAGIRVRDLDTHQSSLEDIFVSLVKEQQ
jgi:ABC-2 type transport system ATP-binding protein